MSRKTANKKTGNLGERIAAKYLKSLGYQIIETNYSKKWGELDIVAKNNNVVHFVEVKTHSYETRRAVELSFTGDNWRPEEQVDKRKLHQIGKILQTWLLEHRWTGKWQIDVVAVRMSEQDQYASVNFIENVIAE